MAKSNAGAKTKMTDATVKKLEEAFLVGATDLEACVHAGISKQTLYNYCKDKPAFLDRKETLKNQPTLRAKIIVDKALQDSDLVTAHKVIDRKEGMKIKQDLTVAGDISVSVNFT